jgi:hypothetical protein
MPNNFLMMKMLLFIFAMAGLAATLQAQTPLSNDLALEKEIVRTGNIHSPLTPDSSRSFETMSLLKKVLAVQSLVAAQEMANWKHSGLGKISFSKAKTISGNGSLRMEFPTFTGKRAKGSPSDPDYATYGNCSASLNVGGQNWGKYNRIAFKIYPDCDGARVINVDFYINNQVQAVKAGYNRYNGDHLVHLENRQWNTCFLDIGEYQRDRIAQIGFSVSLKGKDETTGDSVIYYIDQIELQQIENPEQVSGWHPGEDKLVYSTSGYQMNGPKTAIVNMSETSHENGFSLEDAVSGQSVYSGKVKQQTTTTGTYSVLDFSDFNKPGNYRIKVGDISSHPFLIDKNVWENSLWRTINFVFCQRCGYAVPRKHGDCHVDLFSEHNGQRIAYSGGWHDAGDLSQQTLQTGDVAYNFLEAYSLLKDKNPALAERLREEGEWGLDFILKNRYGDGYRGSSMGLLIWQDGIVGSFDDITSVRVQNNSFDNFLYAAYEAYAALTLDNDPALQEHLRKVAKEDFGFSIGKYEAKGMDEFQFMYEHSYNTSRSQYMATVSWAASMLYKLTGEAYYAEKARTFIEYTLGCQCVNPVGTDTKISGFFYRDQSNKVIVHYNHQSREQVYMQALELLCRTQPNHADFGKWKKSIELYGGYLKNLMPFTAPYGMLASGVYGIDENQDDDSFNHMHLFMPPNAKESYTEQLKNGVKLDDTHYLKRFPVWFSIFNGNTAVHLSMGKAAVICGKFLKDEELLRIGLEQLYWVVGKNPFGQSLISGEGWNYPQMDNFSSGESVGEMPVGIRSLGNEDVPYWPQTNTSCYKEVWVTSAGKWISLASEY